MLSLRRVAYLLFRPVGRTARFKWAIVIARLLAPLSKLTGYVKMPPFALDTYREYVTATFLQSLTSGDIEFDPVINVNGAQYLPKGGAILVSGHFYLNFVFLRWLRDQGRAPSVFLRLGVDTWRFVGTQENMSILDPDRHSLLRVRELLRSGKFVVSAIDNNEPFQDWAELGVSERALFVSDRLFRLAEQLGCPVLFFFTRLEKKGTVVTEIVPATTRNAERTLAEFSIFMSEALSQPD